ncbi:MAG: hypothetical protein KDK33_14695 [Leptospiraceae bacterium]|nr:hypothetical protein [Leptospiraceae bacterium]
MNQLILCNSPRMDGVSPNPYWGICTLNTGHPAVRLIAEPGDWVGGVNWEIDGGRFTNGHLRFLMKVDSRRTMAEYDEWVRSQLPEKIPNLEHRNPIRHLGDAIYDFRGDEPRPRLPFISQAQMKLDLLGKYALSSHHFLYFGDNCLNLPEGTLEKTFSGKPLCIDLSSRTARMIFAHIEKFDISFGELPGDPQIYPYADESQIRAWSEARQIEAELELQLN